MISQPNCIFVQIKVYYILRWCIRSSNSVQIKTQEINIISDNIHPACCGSSPMIPSAHPSLAEGVWPVSTSVLPCCWGWSSSPQVGWISGWSQFLADGPDREAFLGNAQDCWRSWVHCPGRRKKYRRRHNCQSRWGRLSPGSWGPSWMKREGLIKDRQSIW